MFGNGALIGGLVTTEEDVTEDEARAIKSDLNRRTLGVKNAGDVAFVNRTLKFTPWTTSSKDAQFLESRAHQVEEIARAYGVPKVLLAQDGASTWGSGIAELNRGLAKFTLMSWTTRIEQRLSRLLARPRFVEFDYAGLMQGAPAEEITLLIEQVNAGLLTPNEARAIRNLPPLPVSAEVPPSEEAA
jgi:HK97 family phage portal protein